MTTSQLPARDQAFFEEVHKLLETDFPDLQEKYGIWRVHSHFDLKEDQVFHETSNSETQESTLRIISKNELPAQAFASTWKLTSHGPLVCTWCCDDATPHPTP